MNVLMGRRMANTIGFMIPIALLSALKGETRKSGENQGNRRLKKLPYRRVNVSTGHRMVTWGQKLGSASFRNGQEGGRLRICYLKASAHQTVNREKREEWGPGRAVAGEFAQRDETRFGKRFGMAGIFL
jgi:hypothetical protein